ncbi:retrovirus-related pol polyprotein from transposon TNT 1-94 [Tanacetum coccineum]
MTTLAEFMIIAGADNRPPMLDKIMYDSWKSRMELYIKNRENERLILNSVENGPLIWPTVEENGETRKKKYEELSAAEKLQANCDLKVTNIVLQGLPPDVYAIVNHHKGSATSSGANNASGQTKVVKCYNCQGEGHMARQCTLPKRPMNIAWFKEKEMLAEAQESGQVLDEDQLAFLADHGITDCHDVLPIIIHNVAFQTDDLDAYDSDYDDISSAKAVLMANLSNYGSDVLSEVPNFETYQNDMDNQSVQAMKHFEQTFVEDYPDNEITTDSNIIPYSQYLQETQQAAVQDTNSFEKQNESLTVELERYKERFKTFKQRLNIDLSSREKLIDYQMDDMIRDRLALKQQIDLLEQNLSKQIKEKESLLQTFNVFKKESKEKESKYMDKEIDLEKKIKELDNIVYKVGKSAQTVHMLTKPQVFYDDTHKQALGYQNPFNLKKTQRIKPTLYDGSVISRQHDVIPVTDEEETLILEELSRSKMIAKQNDPILKEKKINTTLINYVELN